MPPSCEAAAPGRWAYGSECERKKTMFEHEEPISAPVDSAALHDQPTATPPEPAAPQEPAATAAQNDGEHWHAEAGRKGALRVQQLIEEGKLYEKEHGLKRGRQRIRQLIELG